MLEFIVLPWPIVHDDSADGDDDGEPMRQKANNNIWKLSE